MPRNHTLVFPGRRLQYGEIMRFVETITNEKARRLTDTDKRSLFSKVASNQHTRFNGYPDNVGWVPHCVIDPTHREWVDNSVNLCSDTDPERTALFTAVLGFPHLTIQSDTQTESSIQKLMRKAGGTNVKELRGEKEAVQTILYERERMRMDAVTQSHQFALDEETQLTADPVEKILLNAGRAAKRRDGEVTLDGIKTVLNFERTRLADQLPFSVSELSCQRLRQYISGKTCSPPIPTTRYQKRALLYWIENPNASIREVVDETGVNRGRFETFRLIRPDPSCYNREYIEDLCFDMDHIFSNLVSWLEKSRHTVYQCDVCDNLFYSSSSLKKHTVISTDHDSTQVSITERPTEKNSTASQQGVVTEEADVSVSDMVDQFNRIDGSDSLDDHSPDSLPESTHSEKNPADAQEGVTTSESRTDESSTTTDSNLDSQSVSELLSHSENPVETAAEALDSSTKSLVSKMLSSLTEEERTQLKRSLQRAEVSSESLAASAGAD